MSVDQIVEESARGTRRGVKAFAPSAPQVSLLPTEIRGLSQVKRLRGRLLAGVVATAMLVAGATGLASMQAGAASDRVDVEAAALTGANLRLTEFADVQALQQRIALGRAAERVGSSTAINWRRWIDLIEADMPESFTVTAVQVDAATPFADYEQGDSPLEAPRAATVQLTASTYSIEELPIWLRKLKSMPAYADATPMVTAADLNDFTVQLTVHLTTEAYITPLNGDDR